MDEVPVNKMTAIDSGKDTKMNYDIEISSVTKRFESNVVVEDVSLAVEKGELFGLLGPNGAGKSTLTKMVSGMTNPTSGSIKVAGYNILESPMAVNELLGVIPQDIVLLKGKW